MSSCLSPRSATPRVPSRALPRLRGRAGASALPGARGVGPPSLARPPPAPAPAPPALAPRRGGARRPSDAPAGGGAREIARRAARAPVPASSSRSRRASVVRAGKAPRAFGLDGDAEDLLRKYGDAAQATGQYIGKASGMRPPKARVGRPRNRRAGDGDGVFLLLLVNVVFFVLDQWLHLPWMKDLYLNHMRPQWWQWVTSIFCHANWSHLSGNIFFLYVFGKIVEEEEGAFGVWASYLLTGVGAGLASWILLPKGTGGVLGVGAAATVSLGASGAVFGLFAVSVLTKFRMDLRKLLEAVILGQFVLKRFIGEAQAAAASGGVGAGGVNHFAHLAGALAGVALIAALAKLLPPEE